MQVLYGRVRSKISLLLTKQLIFRPYKMEPDTVHKLEECQKPRIFFFNPIITGRGDYKIIIIFRQDENNLKLLRTNNFDEKSVLSHTFFLKKPENKGQKTKLKRI